MTQLLKQYGPKEISAINKDNTFKQYTNVFNPFNSWKVMFHVERMKSILSWINGETGFLPPPVYVTIDPTDVCNHGCPWCISSTIQESDNTTLSEDILLSLAYVLNEWHESGGSNLFKVDAIVNAGGGEPLVNPATAHFLHQLGLLRAGAHGPEFSMITNGELLTESIAEILANYATWTGFSVDAGNADSHKKMHVPKKKNVNNFERIINNIKMLCDLRDKSGREIKLNIGYKFNIHPDSFESMVEGAKIAKEIGCDEIQFKPTFIDNAFEIMPPIIDQSQKNIMEARKLFEDDKFKVQGMIHKFGPEWTPNHDFSVCTMTPLGLIFSADGTMYLCCDRRGDKKLQLGPWHDGKKANADMIKSLWGSKKHRELIKAIDISECPRCSMYFYNKVVHETFSEDKMNRNFL